MSKYCQFCLRNVLIWVTLQTDSTLTQVVSLLSRVTAMVSNLVYLLTTTLVYLDPFKICQIMSIPYSKILWPQLNQNKSQKFQKALRIYFHPHAPFTCCFTYYSPLFHTTEPHCTLWHYRNIIETHFYFRTLTIAVPFASTFFSQVVTCFSSFRSLPKYRLSSESFACLPSYLILQTLHTHHFVSPFPALSIQNCSLSIMLYLLFFLFTSIFPTRIQTL